MKRKQPMRGNRKRDVADRFWEKVDRSAPNGCWEWTAALFQSTGYGQFQWDYKTIPAHRVAFMLIKGNIPKGRYVLHTCDNRRCVNPAHLWLGTLKENSQDMVAKGRNPDRKGELHPRARVTADDVIKIRALHALGVMTHGAIADLFGISRTNVTLIVNRKAWQHVT